MTRSLGGCLAVAAICACLLIPGAAAGERQRVAGTRVTIEPPAGFSPAEQFPGFLRADIGASIMVTELPGSAAEVREGMTEEGLAARGMVLAGIQAGAGRRARGSPAPRPARGVRGGLSQVVSACRRRARHDLGGGDLPGPRVSRAQRARPTGGVVRRLGPAGQGRPLRGAAVPAGADPETQDRQPDEQHGPF
ncbi:MAG: hypothetical protein MZV70_50120 [Desulfobacterales bacterium]|nr:hypothetical protein [Desulfobacterales bacterium]